MTKFSIEHLSQEGEEGFVGLDIGCGKRPKEGWVGLDITVFPGVTKYDMTQDLLPYENSTVDAIRCINTLEHIERKYYKHWFNDCYRALKIGGTLEFIVPNLAKSVDHAWGDITHLSPWVPHTIKYLTGERPRYASYGFLPWELVTLEDLPEEPRDMRVVLKTRFNSKRGKKYGE